MGASESQLIGNKISIIVKSGLGLGVLLSDSDSIRARIYAVALHHLIDGDGLRLLPTPEAKQKVMQIVHRSSRKAY